MKQIKIWWSLWKYYLPALLNVLISVFCYVVGWQLSDANDALPFSRSGAAATVFAIGFTLYDYRSALERSERSASDTFRKVANNCPFTGQDFARNIDRKLQYNTARVVRATSRTHALVLMIATFVWGFGDLASRWM